MLFTHPCESCQFRKVAFGVMEGEPLIVLSTLIAKTILSEYNQNIEKSRQNLNNLNKREDQSLVLLDSEQERVALKYYEKAHMVINHKLGKLNEAIMTMEDRTLDGLLALLNSLALTMDGIPIMYQYHYFKGLNKQLQALLRVPEKPAVAIASPTIRMEYNLLAAERGGVALLFEYFRHPHSPESIAIQKFTRSILQVREARAVPAIPKFVEHQRKGLILRMDASSARQVVSALYKYKPSTADMFNFSPEGEAILFEKILANRSSFTPEQYEYVIEKIIFEEVGTHILKLMEKPEEDERHCNITRIISKATHSQFDIFSISDNPLTEAIALIRTMERKYAPTDKLLCVRHAIQSLKKEISQGGDAKEWGADDLLDHLIYCIGKANLKQLPTQVAFTMKHARPRTMQSDFGADFASFEAAVRHIGTMNTDNGLQSALGNNVAPKMSVQRDLYLANEEADVLYIAENMEGTRGVRLTGIQLYYIPSWAVSPLHTLSTMVVHTGNPEHSAVVYPVAKSNSVLGTISFKPKSVEMCNVATAKLIHPSILIESGDFESAKPNLSAIIDYCYINDNFTEASLEEHIEACKQKYGLSKEEVISTVSSNLAYLGIGTEKTQHVSIDFFLLNGLMQFQKAFLKTDTFLFNALYESSKGLVSLIKEFLGSSAFSDGASTPCTSAIIPMLQYYHCTNINGKISPTTIAILKRHSSSYMNEHRITNNPLFLSVSQLDF